MFQLGKILGKSVTPLYNATKYPTYLWSCNGHPLVMDNHPFWTSWSLCEEGVGRRDPCPSTWGLEHTKKHKKHQKICLGTCRRAVEVYTANTLTSAHGTRWGRPLGWGSAVVIWRSSFHWRGTPGWHPFKEGFYIPWIIVFSQKRVANINTHTHQKTTFSGNILLSNTRSIIVQTQLRTLRIYLWMMGPSFHQDLLWNHGGLWVDHDCGIALEVLVCQHSQTEALSLAPLWLASHQETGGRVQITITNRSFPKIMAD